MTQGFLVASAFLASAVEFVEALTIVLASGLTRGWRSSLAGLGTATVSGSTFAGNTAGFGNGALNNEPGGVLTQFDNRFAADQLPDVFP